MAARDLFSEARGKKLYTNIYRYIIYIVLYSSLHVFHVFAQILKNAMISVSQVARPCKLIIGAGPLHG